MEELLETFFNGFYEEDITEAMFERDYVYPQAQMEDYVLSLVATPYRGFIDYICSHYCAKAITTAEIPQISNYDMSTRGVCDIMRNMDDSGVDYNELGVMMFLDGAERNPGAYLKFGENHVKGASFHGLTHCCGGKWFLTCLGRIYPDLDEEMRSALSARTLLRKPFFHLVISEAMEHDVNIRDFMPGLALTTQKRRSSSCMHFLNVIIKQCEQESIPIHSIIFSANELPI